MAATLPLSLDLAQAAHHLACLEPEDVTHIFAALPEAPHSPGSARQYFGRLADVAATLTSMQRNGCGVFVTVNAMQGPRRRRSDVSRIRALWVERDGPGPSLPLTPSLVIATSPGRSHDYLLTDVHDAPSPAEAHLLNRHVASRYGGDLCATDPARLLRLAGTWNLKRLPFLATITIASGYRYSAATLRAAFAAQDRETRFEEPRSVGGLLARSCASAPPSKIRARPRSRAIPKRSCSVPDSRTGRGTPRHTQHDAQPRGFPTRAARCRPERDRSLVGADRPGDWSRQCRGHVNDPLGNPRCTRLVIAIPSRRGEPLARLPDVPTRCRERRHSASRSI